MKLKQVVRYRLNFEGEWVTTSCVFMALAFFLQAVYFFGFANLRQIGFFAIVFQMILPMLLELAWLVLLRGIQLNAPGIYGILAAVLCVLVMVQTVFTGALLAAILSVPALLIAGLLVLAVTGGMVGRRYVGVCGCVLVLVLRVLFGGLSLLLPELAVLCGISAVMTLLGALEDPKK